MSKVDVVALARVARLPLYEETNVGCWRVELEAFASLVLEEAIKACEDVQEGLGHSHAALGAYDCVQAVRNLRP